MTSCLAHAVCEHQRQIVTTSLTRIQSRTVHVSRNSGDFDNSKCRMFLLIFKSLPADAIRSELHAVLPENFCGTDISRKRSRQLHEQSSPISGKDGKRRTGRSARGRALLTQRPWGGLRPAVAQALAARGHCRGWSGTRRMRCKAEGCPPRGAMPVYLRQPIGN